MTQYSRETLLSLANQHNLRTSQPTADTLDVVSSVPLPTCEVGQSQYFHINTPRAIDLPPFFPPGSETYESRKSARQAEILDSGLRENYRGTVGGFSVFEGEVRVLGNRQGRPDGDRIKIRLVLDKDENVTKEVSLPNLFFETIGSFFAVENSIDTSVNPDLQHFLDLLEVYELSNQESRGQNQPDYPLTIVRAHGQLHSSGRHTLCADQENEENYITELFIYDLYQHFPPSSTVIKPPLLLYSCDREGKFYHQFSSTVFNVFYRTSIMYRGDRGGSLTAGEIKTTG